MSNSIHEPVPRPDRAGDETPACSSVYTLPKRSSTRRWPASPGTSRREADDAAKEQAKYWGVPVSGPFKTITTGTRKGSRCRMRGTPDSNPFPFLFLSFFYSESGGMGRAPVWEKGFPPRLGAFFPTCIARSAAKSLTRARGRCDSDFAERFTATAGYIRRRALFALGGSPSPTDVRGGATGVPREQLETFPDPRTHRFRRQRAETFSRRRESPWQPPRPRHEPASRGGRGGRFRGAIRTSLTAAFPSRPYPGFRQSTLLQALDPSRKASFVPKHGL